MASSAPREKLRAFPSLAKREKVAAGWRPDEGRRDPLTKFRKRAHRFNTKPSLPLYFKFLSRTAPPCKQ
jgi:hypothetical protein